MLFYDNELQDVKDFGFMLRVFRETKKRIWQFYNQLSGLRLIRPPRQWLPPLLSVQISDAHRQLNNIKLFLSREDTSILSLKKRWLNKRELLHNAFIVLLWSFQKNNCNIFFNLLCIVITYGLQQISKQNIDNYKNVTTILKTK